MKEDEWIQGYCCAVATLIKLNDGVTTDTMEVFKVGVGNRSIEKLIDLGVDKYDIEVFKQYWKELKNIYP